MLIRKFGRALFLAAAVLSMSLATGPAKAAGDACTDVAYFGPVVSFLSATSNLDVTQPNTLGTALLTAINLRNQYEDSAAPAGCETTKPLLIQLLTLKEDVYYLQAAVKVDEANAKEYQDLIVTVGAPRFAAAGTTFNDAIASLKFPDAIPTALATADASAPAATAMAPQVCTDEKFIAQLQADQATISAMTKINILPAIKMRFDYEDLKAPEGCADAQTFVIRVLANIEDQTSVDVLGQSDTANAATYAKYTTDTYVPRYDVFYNELMAAVPAIAEATPAK